MNGRSTALLSLVLLPLLWLWPSVFGGRVFMPYDVAQAPPVGLTLSPEQMAHAIDGANYDVTEPPIWFVPELVYAGNELREGRLPVWNPHARGGAPLHAHGLIGLCHPPNWLALFADDPRSRLGLVAWFDLALGGLLAFGFLRALSLSLLGAWFGAVVFQLSAPMAANAFFWMRLASFLWLPGVLWSVLAVASGERLRAGPLAALAATVGMAWLGGFPPFAITTSLLGAAFAAWLTLDAWRCRGFPAARAVGARLLLGFLLGGMLAAPQLLPSAAFFPHSARQVAPTVPELAHSTYEAHGLLGLVLPNAFGHPSAQADCPYGKQNVLSLLLTTRTGPEGRPAEPNFNWTEYSIYFGTLGFLLAGTGALLGRSRHRAFAIVALLGCGGLALFVPGVHLLYHLPLVQNVVPMRWLAPTAILFAWLAGLGLQRLLAAGPRLPLCLAGIAAGLGGLCFSVARWPLQWHTADPGWAVQRLATKYGVTAEGVVNHVQGVPPVPHDRFLAAFTRLADEGDKAGLWLLATAVLLAAFAVLRTERQRHLLAIAAGRLTALQLGLHGATVTRGVFCAIDPETTVHAFLRERAAAGAAHGGFAIARGSLGLGLPDQLPPGQLLGPGLRDLAFYTHFDGRSLQPLQHLLGGIGSEIAAKGYLERSLPAGPPANAAVPGLFAHPLFDLYGVRYVLSVGDAPLPHAGEPIAIPGAPKRFFVQERKSAAPRAFVVPGLDVLPDDTAVVQALLQPTFAPQQKAYAIAADVAALALPAAALEDAPARTVTFMRDVATTLELDITAGAARWLVLTDSFLPGWSATIDGAPAPIVRVDHSCRGVVLPTTACRVAFTYSAPGLTTGLLLATFAALGLAVFAFSTRRRALAP